MRVAEDEHSGAIFIDLTQSEQGWMRINNSSASDVLVSQPAAGGATSRTLVPRGSSLAWAWHEPHAEPTVLMEQATQATPRPSIEYDMSKVGPLPPLTLSDGSSVHADVFLLGFVKELRLSDIPFVPPPPPAHEWQLTVRATTARVRLLFHPCPLSVSYHRIRILRIPPHRAPPHSMPMPPPSPPHHHLPIPSTPTPTPLITAPHLLTPPSRPTGARGFGARAEGR